MILFKTTVGITEKYIREKYPEYWIKICNYVTEENITISERIWLYQNKLSKKPKCLNCGNEVNFIKFYRGYRKYCCRKCSVKHTHSNPETKSKRIKKILSYNNDHEIKLEITKKSNNTKSNFSDNRKKEINDKRVNTNLQKYGVENVSYNENIRLKISDKLKISIPKYKNEKTRIRVNNLGYEILEIGNMFKLICPLCKREFEISRKLFNQRNRFNIEICLKCNPNNNNSDFEHKVLKYVKESYGGTILSKYRKFKKYEIDIYLPDLNIGIECNGLYWHSEIYKDKNYHIDKTLFFEKRGIRIIHIWEDDWKYKSDIIKCKIKKLFETDKIIIKKCSIKEISEIESNIFLKNNYLYKIQNSHINIGLYQNNELISILTFNILDDMKKQYHLISFCDELFYSYINSFKKLLNYFIIRYNPSKIISYDRIDWSSDDIYSNFIYIGKTDVNYTYFNKDDGLRISHIPNGSINENKYYKIYDCGSFIYEYNF